VNGSGLMPFQALIPAFVWITEENQEELISITAEVGIGNMDAT
jgi:hypothetical protein